MRIDEEEYSVNEESYRNDDATTTYRWAMMPSIIQMDGLISRGLVASEDERENEFDPV